MIILKSILRKNSTDWIRRSQNGILWWLSYEHRSEPLGLIKGGEFLDYLCNYQRLKKNLSQYRYALNSYVLVP
jgi:hypothetical protein